MKKLLCTIVCLLAGLVLLSQSANAQPRGPYPRVVIGPFDLGDARLFAASVIAGGAMTGTYFAIENHRALKLRGDGKHFSTGAYALTTVGCMTIAPMLAAAIVWSTERRHLTSREALGLGAGCVIPFLGTAIVDAAYRAHPHWR